MREGKNLVIGVIAGFLFGMLILNVITGLKSPHKISELVGDSDPSNPIQINTPAPDFELESLSGEKIKLSKFHGRVVLINFWTTWCGPCRIEMPVFQSMYEQHQNELVILAINEQDSSEEIRTFMNELGLTFNALLDSNGIVHKAYFVRGFPTSYIVDSKGKLLVQHIGVMTKEQLDDYLDEVGL
jgi:thiol-disulfide isomerase/thioredoxin